MTGRPQGSAPEDPDQRAAGQRASSSPRPDLAAAAERASKLRWWERLLSRLGSVVLGWLARLLPATWKLEVVAGQEHAESFLADPKPVIFACWHNRLSIVGRWATRELIRRGIEIMVSLSRDGELLAQVARRTGFGVVRGSARRGGLSGLRALYRTLSRDGVSVGTAPDGSVGPVYEAKPGTVMLAQISGAPILPLAGAAERCWRLGSWDRMIIPKPFSRVTLAIGEPIRVPEKLSSEELAERTRELGERLDKLVTVAEAGVGE